MQSKATPTCVIPGAPRTSRLHHGTTIEPQFLPAVLVAPKGGALSTAGKLCSLLPLRASHGSVPFGSFLLRYWGAKKSWSSFGCQECNLGKPDGFYCPELKRNIVEVTLFAQHYSKSCVCYLFLVTFSPLGC